MPPTAAVTRSAAAGAARCCATTLAGSRVRTSGWAVVRVAASGSRCEILVEQFLEPLKESLQAPGEMAPVRIHKIHRQRRRACTRHHLDKFTGPKVVLHVECGNLNHAQAGKRAGDLGLGIVGADPAAWNSPSGAPSEKPSDDEPGIGLDETLRRMLVAPPARKAAGKKKPA